MPRHRGTYDPQSDQPYELSRSRVEAFVRCPACFWLDRVAGVPFPGIPGFNINANTDTLLKRDFDQYRSVQKAHPLMQLHGLGHLVPYDHADMPKWINSLHFGVSDAYFSVVHEPTHIRFGGGLDDVWLNPATNQLHIVDYKSTAQLSAQPKPISIMGKWKAAYRRQMDMYQWVMRRKGFDVSDIGYFVYVDGQHLGQQGMISDSEPSVSWMKFNNSILPYQGKGGWVEPALHKIRETLDAAESPPHAEGCEYGLFLAGVRGL
ncbi:MAG: hypothetical protein ACR2PW_01220 [Gammaproteobacteria bacterium]